jgi:hypothetical protein
MSHKKMVKGGCWDFPPLIVGCYGFNVFVQYFFFTFDVLCGGIAGLFCPELSLSMFGLDEGNNCLDCCAQNYLKTCHLIG